MGLMSACTLFTGCVIEDSIETLFRDPFDRTSVKLLMVRVEMERYLDSTGRWPTGIESVLAARLRADSTSNWYDAWGGSIAYTPGPPCATLSSWGPDTVAGTGDDVVVRFPIPLCENVDIQGISPMGRAALRSYVASLVRLREAERTRVSENVERATAESLLVEVLRLPPSHEDGPLAYLLFLDNVGGEATARDLACRAIARGQTVRARIDEYLIRLPPIGSEPLPPSVVGTSDLPRSVSSRIDRAQEC